MHTNQLTHTDLKPENILLTFQDLEKVLPHDNRYQSLETQATYSEQDSYHHHPSRLPYYQPVDHRLTIIDFGGATYDKDYHSEIINTRQYRAPEVILQCCKWGHSSDVWSIGCIIMELITGQLYFPTHENYEHLAMIIKSCGPIPQWMAFKCQNMMKKHFMPLTNKLTGQQEMHLNWPRDASTEASIKRVEEL